jgi:[ribosomal protein S5]-alanine N-acetyltransferase
VERILGRPAILTEPDLLDAPIVLRPLRLSHARTVHNIRAVNESWLQKWEPSHPEAPLRPSPARSALSMVRKSSAWSYVSVLRQRSQVVRGTALPWAVCYGGQFAGQVTIWGITWGSARSARIGYWIDEAYAGRGITPTALALAVDYCFQVLHLHRLEAGIQPTNSASRRVVEKLGFREEGTRVREVHINGAWRDHTYYAITAEEVPAGLLYLWRSSHAASRTDG